MTRPGSRSGLPTVRGMARGWRWGSRPLVPASAESHRPLPAAPREFSTEWARTPLVRSVRAMAQGAGLKPLIWAEVAPTVSGLDALAGTKGPVVFAANHSSHLDAPLVLCSLPPAWRNQTLVTAAADYFFDDWWRAFGTALVFGTVPLDRTGGLTAAAPSSSPHGLLADGWSLVMFPEGTRAPDGQMAGFKTGAARLALAADIPVVPIGIRGSYAAMPRGRSWPVSGRPRVSVRFGTPLRAVGDESAKTFTQRIAAEITRLRDEDTSTWWESLRRVSAEGPAASGPPSEAATWRKVWASTEPVRSSARTTPWD